VRDAIRTGWMSQPERFCGNPSALPAERRVRDADIRRLLVVVRSIISRTLNHERRIHVQHTGELRRDYRYQRHRSQPNRSTANDLL
jgi:hypothetical protein